MTPATSGANAPARPARPLALAKLAPPALRSDAVARKRLLDLLDSGHRAKLVLIQAPAGYGKTTLMAQWSKRLQDADERFGWITLDEPANDPANLLASLVAALLRESPSGTPDLLAVINRCASSHVRFTLFLDEVEALREAGSLLLIELLLEYSPANLHIVMGTRNEPSLPLARLRVRQEVVDISSQELRFLRGEAAQFLYVRSGTQLAKATLNSLMEKTEGWAAALQLIAMSLSRSAAHDDMLQHLSGSSAQIMEYLAVDVVGRLSGDIRQFLLETSVLRRLSAPLCDAATGRSDSAAMLLKLETGNLFVQALDSGRNWYRYHALFSKFLQDLLERDHPGRAKHIAGKAADWCAENGLIGEAVDYNLHAGDTGRAIERMEQCIDNQIQVAQFRTLFNWLRALPREEIDRRPALVIANAWAMNFCQEYRLAGESIQQLRRLSQDPQTARVFRTTLLALEPVMLARIGDIETMLSHAEAAWPEVGREVPRERSMLANQLAYGYTVAGRHDDAQRCLREAMHCHAQTRPFNVFGMAHTVGHEAIDDACIGDLQGAIRKLQSIEKLVADHIGDVVPHMEPGFLPANTVGFCAELLYERNEIDEAEACLDRYYRFVESIPAVETILLAYLTRARIHLSRGEAEEAEETLAAAGRHATRTGMPRIVAAMDWERVRIALLAGDVGRARLIARSLEQAVAADDVPALIVPSEDINGAGIGGLRLMIHDGRSEQALARLKLHVELATRQLRRRRLAKLKILEALALGRLQRTGEALQAMAEAARMALPMGVIRSFIDEGEAGRPMLQQLCDDPALKADRKLLTHVQAILAAYDGEGGVPAAPADRATGALVESLSSREIQILQRLSQGYSNLAVAQQLFVSTNTIKWHLRQIYGKLGAKNRSQAIFLARRHGLLHP